MDAVRDMIKNTLQSDSVATVGLRALMNQSTSPYGIHHYNLTVTLADDLAFSSGKRYITYFQITGVYDTSMPRNNFSTMAKQETYQLTVWNGDDTVSCDKLIDRIKYLLEGKHRTTNPTTEAMVFNIKCEWEGPTAWDDDFLIFTKSVRFRVWIQDCTIVGD